MNSDRAGEATTVWKRAWGGPHGAWGWGRWALFLLVTAGLWWQPSSGLTDGLMVALGLAALARPGRLWRAWGNPAGVAFLLLAVWAVASAGWSLEASDVFRDCAKQLPLMLGVLGLGTWLCGNGGLVVRRAIGASAAVVTARLAVEAAQLVRICGWGRVMGLARYVDTLAAQALLEAVEMAARHGLAVAEGAREVLELPLAGHRYLYTHPNVSSMLAGMAALVFLAYLPALWRRRREAATRGGRALAWAGIAGSLAGMAADVGFLVMMGSRGPQMAFAASALMLPIFWLPGWKWRLAALAAGVLAAAVLVAAAVKINPRFADRATMRGANRRVDIWRCAGDRVAQRPWTGYGFGKKAFHRMIYEHPELRAPRGMPFVYPHAHSYWLMLPVQGGYVALGLGVVAWGALALGLLLALKRLPPRPLAARATPALLLTLLAMVQGYGIADYPDSTLRFAQFLLLAAALACMADAADRPQERDET